MPQSRSTKTFSLQFILLTCLVCYSLFCVGQPATIKGDYPDPTIIYSKGKYYSIGTSSEWGPHFPIYESNDLRQWKQTGFLFNETPDWAQSSFWAAEYFYHEGLYYVYYSAKRKSDGVSCIGVATSKFPDRDFVDRGIVVDYGSESIDAFVVREGKDLYMTWKAYGLDERPIELLGSKLSSDGLRLEGEPFSLLMDTARVGIEGQSFLKNDGYYYMFYSAGACCGVNCDYHVKAVRAKNIKGPYEHVGTKVLLGENNDWKCMGHGTFVEGKDGQLYYLFHGYSKTGTTYTGREGLLAQLDWADQGQPTFTFLPATSKETTEKMHIDFRKKKPVQSFWQWDFRYASPTINYGRAGLELSGHSAADNPTGVVLAWRPSSLRYRLETVVDLGSSSVAAAKGLVIYGDKDRSIGLSVKGNTVEFWRMDGGKRQQLATGTVPVENGTLHLRLELCEGLRCRAYIGQENQWSEITGSDAALAVVDGLSPWDRSPRPGLLFHGKESEKAVFSDVTLTSY
ncbi:glycoside hydrolase family 43 protein [Sphingobacterium bambusae]|uniref:Glycoside hydrolase family 43 protein n=1 Tax=Sphingobacterium bambusae TaxID=662858 RepID=A0ABW6BQE1_9SPHI|nr:glycoside hydrolase family 43 protein [Sphingobacterium bambusae]WPL48111.1 glycoside hydrolase family 43 protein [Sphingobacterium bambusae]